MRTLRNYSFQSTVFHLIYCQYQGMDHEMETKLYLSLSEGDLKMVPYIYTKTPSNSWGCPGINVWPHFEINFTQWWRNMCVHFIIHSLVLTIYQMNNRWVIWVSTYLFHWLWYLIYLDNILVSKMMIGNLNDLYI